MPVNEMRFCSLSSQFATLLLGTFIGTPCSFSIELAMVLVRYRHSKVIATGVSRRDPPHRGVFGKLHRNCVAEAFCSQGFGSPINLEVERRKK